MAKISKSQHTVLSTPGSHNGIIGGSGQSTATGGDVNFVRSGVPSFENLDTVLGGVNSEGIVYGKATGALLENPINVDTTGKITNQKVPTVATKKNRVTYASLFKNNRMAHVDYTLDFVETGDAFLEFEDDVVDTVEEAYGICLLGYVVNGKPPTAALLDLVRRWGPNITFQIHDSGWITFKFPNLDIKSRVLSGGTYMVYGFHLFLKEMPRFFRFREEDLNTLPVWIRIHGLPPSCWNCHILSRVASKVGKPVHMDMFTHDRKRFNYARVFVEIDTSKPRVKEMKIGIPIGKLDISFVFEDELEYCNVCHRLGHAKGSCVATPLQLTKGKVIGNADEGRGRS